MGFFTAKCGVCGKTVGLNRYHVAKDNDWCCSECLNKACRQTGTTVNVGLVTITKLQELVDKYNQAHNYNKERELRKNDNNKLNNIARICLSCIIWALSGTLLMLGDLAFFLSVVLSRSSKDSFLSIILSAISIIIFLVAVIFCVRSISKLRDMKLERLTPTTKFKVSKFVTAIVVAIMFIAGLIASGIMIYAEYKQNYVGYKSGDYSQHPCYDCDKPADGGCWIVYGEEESYHCKYHFDERKKRLEESIKDNDDFGHSEASVYYKAQNIVKGKLKAPSTANFGSISETTISRNGNTWTISGWVDAQNSFGATIRSHYTVKITFTSKNNYTIDLCNIN